MFNQYSYVYVEDDPMSRAVMQMMMARALKVERYAVLENSEDFITQVRGLAFKPDVFLLDIHMYPYNGYDLLEMIQGEPDYADALVIAVTASVMSEEVAQLKAAAFSGVIAKPIDVMSFPNLLKRMLGGEQVWHIN